MKATFSDDVVTQLLESLEGMRGGKNAPVAMAWSFPVLSASIPSNTRSMAEKGISNDAQVSFVIPYIPTK